jgi:hypothetical protein
MRQTRKLAQGVWHEIRSRINNREPLFRRSKATALFDKVLCAIGLQFVAKYKSGKNDTREPVPKPLNE